MRRLSDTGQLIVLMLVSGAAVLASALAEYGYGIKPCDLCLWQRYCHVAVLLFALGGMLLPYPRLFIWLALTALVVGVLVAGYHLGAVYGWWVPKCEGAGHVSSIEAYTALLTEKKSCTEGIWRLWGFPTPAWNLVLSSVAIGLLLDLGKWVRKRRGYFNTARNGV